MTRQAYELDLRQYAAWCRGHDLALFAARRSDIEGFARDLEARGRAQATKTPAAVHHRRAVPVRRRRGPAGPLARRARPPHAPGLRISCRGLDRNELGALVAAGLGPAADHALISLLAFNGLRVSEATGADIENLGIERGHRTLVVTRKGGKVVTIPLVQIDGIYVSRAEQNSIRELTAEAARSVIDAHLTTGDSWWESASDNGFDIPGGRWPATAYTRQGQQVFRELMLDRFGSACAFTGANPPGALEAAHLYMFSEAPEHDLAGGLLLRRDLHALFDRDLITIDPETWTIDVAPELHDYPALKALQDQPIQIHPSLRPSKNYLRRHAMRARATWTR
jgi:hypothetical protein